jgi:hypothetical protein
VAIDWTTAGNTQTESKNDELRSRKKSGEKVSVNIANTKSGISLDGGRVKTASDLIVENSKHDLPLTRTVRS